MNDWNVEGFAQFYAAAHPESPRVAFAWQRRLAERVLGTGVWPEVIDAPTGSGKTAVIDLHLFAVACMATKGSGRVPRRLSMVVDRRAIVDDHEQYSRRLREVLLAARDQNDILGDVYRALAGLQRRDIPERRPFGVAVLRGGASPSSLWLDDPAECQVICATPDMWGSRILFRPYGASALSAARAAGLLAYDSVVVIDEAHLARQFTYATRTVREQLLDVPNPVSDVPLQVVAMTATQPSSAVSEGVREVDLDGSDPGLLPRLTSPKHTSLLPVGGWPPKGAGRRKTAVTIAAEAIRLRDRAGGTIACIVNTVDMATAVKEELQKAVAGRHKILAPPVVEGDVELLVGRMRPYDVAELRRRRPGVLDLSGNPDVAFLVATQVIEVGLDLDFSSMVTELASATSLAQRAGRVNRVGARERSWITVITPDAEVPPRGAPPYEQVDLQHCLTWLRSITQEPGGLNPINCIAKPPPEARLPRAALMPVEPWDGMLLANTSLPLFAEPDLRLWLNDSFDEDLDVDVIVRKGLTSDPGSSMELLRVTPPERHEAFRGPLSQARWFLDQGDAADVQRTFIFRGGEVLPAVQVNAPVPLRPGDTLVVPDSAKAFLHGVFVPQESKAVPASDVYEAVDERHRTRSRPHVGRRVRLGDAFRRLGVPGISVRLREIGQGSSDPDAALIEFLRSLVADSLDTSDEVDLLRAMLHDDRKYLAVAWAPDTAESFWVVVMNTARFSADEEVRQVWSRRRVLLDDHSAAVAERARAAAKFLQLSADIEEALAAAGLFHDFGKDHARFQFALGNDMADEGARPLAKSGMRSPVRIRSAWQRAGLGRWRHEQLSAVKAAGALSPIGDPQRDLAVRLVGTSHGRGRPMFEQAALEVMAGSNTDRDLAEDLFDGGGWEDLIEATHRKHGVWGCAYLEAILRAVDAQVSGEGR